MKCNNNIEKQLARFLKDEGFSGAKIVVGFSGGIDSWSLVLALLAVQKQFDLEIHLAHVDHGWREESFVEASFLEKWALEHEIPFYLKKLEVALFHGNLEKYCREQRMDFFVDIVKKRGLDALFLAHHADDQSETILKRICEGAALSNLKGMESFSTFDGISCCRPFLDIVKAELEDYLRLFAEKPFMDKTNLDQRYLRARMRLAIFPYLEEQFGKNIRSNLCRLGDDALELKGYLDDRIAHLSSYVEYDPYWGLHFHLIEPVHIFELHWFLKSIYKFPESALPRSMLLDIATALSESVANKKFYFKKHSIVVDRSHLFIFQEIKDVKEAPLPLENDMFYDGWQVSVVDCKEKSLRSSWRNLWKEGVVMSIPEGEYLIGALPDSISSKRRSRWSKNKVPSFLYNKLPVIYNEKLEAYDFLDDNRVGGDKKIILKPVLSMGMT